MVIQWSDEDAVYLVTLPEWEGRAANPVAHGHTYREAVEAGDIAVRQLVDAFEGQAWELSVPTVLVST